jgi:Spy/CpxP family protein refolding chaperone
MISHKPFQARRSAVLLLVASAALPACGSQQQAPAPAVAPVAETSTAAPAPAPAPTPAVAPAAPSNTVAETPLPPPPPKHHAPHHHGVVDLFVSSLDSLDLKPEQKTVVASVKGDLAKLDDASKDARKKLEMDVADGVAAGKIDRAKTNADIKALADTMTAAEPTVQSAMNRLHQTLDAEQRKQLLVALREKGKAMHEHAMAEMGPPAGAPAAEGKDAPKHDHDGPGLSHGMEGPGHMADELGLSAEQKEKLRAKLEPQMKAQHDAMKSQMNAAQAHMTAVGEAFQSEKFDAKKAGVAVQAPAMVRTMATQRVQHVETVLAVLTPEQRSKFAAHLREHASGAED